MANKNTVVIAEYLKTDFVWFDGKTPITYSAPTNIAPVVSTALEMWKDDMQQVTGLVPKETSAKKAKVHIIQDDSLSKKEAFSISIKNNQIVVAGSDARGIAYGILELSRLAGVSPWIWWGDVAPEKKSVLALPAGFITAQSPSVEFRGIFINDEDWSSLPWAMKNYSCQLIDSIKITDNKRWKGAIAPEAYEKYFQLLLRLRANTILPAMHECTVPFYFVKGNREMAERYGMVVAASHCEPLMSNAATEWDVRGKGAYNYITNKDAVLDFWSSRLKELVRSENIFTIGMRGKHDGSMEGVKTLQEKTNALQQVIYDQRDLLKKDINKDIAVIPQQFVPYKEVLEIYENGLDIPEDIMLTWCDDNYGYMTRLSDPSEQKRSGGAGVYYHLSYWGRPHSYLWLCTTQPGLIYNEMCEAYNHNARRLWVANVHDPKIAAYHLELFLDMAWNVKTLHATSPLAHLKNTLVRDYGQQVGEKIFPAMQEFYRLTAIRKPEFMGWSQIELDRKKYPRGMSPVTDTEFSLTEFGGELDTYLSDYEKIRRMVSEAEKILPAEKKDAFFAQIKYPVFCAAAMAGKWLHRQKGDYDKSLQAYNEILSLTDDYNNTLSGGKWKHSMSCNPAKLPVFEAPDRRSQEEVAVGQVRNDNYIATNACNFTESSSQVEVIEMLGHSMKAVNLPKGGSLTYAFETGQEGEAVLRTALIPTQSNDRGDLRFSVRIDDEEPQVISLKEPFRSEQWKRNVLRGQAVKTTKHHLKKGKHTLTITALDNHIVVDQWMLDFDAERKFYVFPNHASNVLHETVFRIRNKMINFARGFTYKK
ncbi:MAG: glycosyl hydrolase 115 family protein [Dysgonamonadaceae bacterium]|nr:glycosyl hydrolase 115 family protein [Dysgonamonadaceae bacterium]